MNKGEKEKKTYHTEDKVESRVNVSTPFIWEMALDGRGNKYTISVVIQSIDSFHWNLVIHDIRVEDKTYKESVKRLNDVVTYANGPGHCKNYVSTPFIFETTLDGMGDKYTISVDIHMTDSNESPCFKNKEENDRSMDTLSLRFNDSLPNNKDEVNFLSGYVSRSIKDTLVKRDL